MTDFRITKEDFEDLTDYEEFVRECEEMNPGSTGYTSDFD